MLLRLVVQSFYRTLLLKKHNVDATEEQVQLHPGGQPSNRAVFRLSLIH